MSDEAQMNEALQAIHDAEQAGEPVNVNELAQRLGADPTGMGTRVFGALNSRFVVVVDSIGRLALTDSGRARIGIVGGAEGAPQDG